MKPHGKTPKRVEKFGQATYDLDKLKVLLCNKRTRYITQKARIGASVLNLLTDDEIVGCCLLLKKSDIKQCLHI
jgi:hypothetical protein